MIRARATAGLIRLLLVVLAALAAQPAAARSDRLIDDGWRSTVFDARADGQVPGADQPFQRPDFDDARWAIVSVPHNWQGYSYDRQVRNGSRHGTAWYRRHLTLGAPTRGQHVFLMFEGVNAYATVWLNGRAIGRHGGGLTSFTLDATAAAKAGDNVLAVRVDNPKGITDLPWAPGDDQPQSGFSEGSEPFGIFRPVHVIYAAALRVRPFGVYAWGGKADVDAAHASLTVRTEVENLSARVRSFEVIDQLIDPDGRVVAEVRSRQQLNAGASATVDRPFPTIANPRLWSPAHPTLYTLRATIAVDGKAVDSASTPYGIRTVEIATDEAGHRRLLVNGKPFAIRGIAEYEHMLGNSQAFSADQVTARLSQVEAAGFNAFRDAHYPHNLRYGEKIERDGLMWWPQFNAHNWFDNPAYRANFLKLLADWVRERRNNPAVFLWGLQNESKLPKAFAEQAMDVIRALDPTASRQRLVVTCNGGEGTDWNVPQNWSGTYGGDPDNYAEEVKKEGLVGEYGAWRSLGLHAEAPYGDDVWSENKMATLEQKKLRLADSVADQSVGQFLWVLATHENPGRPMRADGTQIWDGIRPLDHVGPANNKGLMTLWGEPVDAYYMFRARQVPARVAPVVYIVSHTWPDRWTGPGVKSGIEVYSNCDSVELFNDAAGRLSLGRKQPDADGRFVWNHVDIRYNMLSARCYVGGKVAAHDAIVLDNLPAAPDADRLVADPAPIAAGKQGLHYLYRVNVGGKAFTDAAGHRWLGDRHWVAGARWGWTSWADRYPTIDPALGSRRLTHDPIEGARDQRLFQAFRYGRSALNYRFAVPDGRYRVELYFVEPWYGRTGIDARGWRLFDVAVNGRTVLHDLDIFREAGFDHALRKVVYADVRGGVLTVSFPKVAAGQAILAGLAIAGTKAGPAMPDDAGTDLFEAPRDGVAAPYLDNGNRVFAGGAARWTRLPNALLDSDFIEPSSPTVSGTRTLALRVPVDLYLALEPGEAAPTGWQPTDYTADAATVGPIRTELARYRFATRRAAAGERVSVPANAPVFATRALPSPYTPGAFSFGGDAGVHEAEAGTIDNGSIATRRQGYGGQAYVGLGAGKAGITWPLETGAAGKHDFRLRYALPSGRTDKGVLSVISADGIVAARMPVELGGGEDWQSASVATPDAINAGHYTLRLSMTDGTGLEIDSITVR